MFHLQQSGAIVEKKVSFTVKIYKHLHHYVTFKPCKFVSINNKLSLNDKCHLLNFLAKYQSDTGPYRRIRFFILEIKRLNNQNISILI
jgi:hypothetical protein